MDELFNLNGINKVIPTKSDYIKIKNDVIEEKKHSPEISYIKILIDCVISAGFEIETIGDFIINDGLFYSIIEYECENLKMILTDKIKRKNIADLF